jgi:hypothetical protein
VRKTGSSEDAGELRHVACDRDGRAEVEPPSNPLQRRATQRTAERVRQSRRGSRTPAAPIKALLHLFGEAPDPIGRSMLIKGASSLLLLFAMGVFRFWGRA